MLPFIFLLSGNAFFLARTALIGMKAGVLGELFTTTSDELLDDCGLGIPAGFVLRTADFFARFRMAFPIQTKPKEHYNIANTGDHLCRTLRLACQGNNQ